MSSVKKLTNQFPEQVTIVQEPLKDLFVWTSASRPFKKRNRETYTTIGAIIFLLAVILIFMQEWLLIGVIISIGFLFYVLSTVQPTQVEHKITTKGMVTEGKRYDWNMLYCFWFFNKWENRILGVETRIAFPKRLMFLLPKSDEGKVRKIMEKYLIEEKPSKSFIDKAAIWLQKKVPLESD